jgi:hypothetical protein
MNTNEKNARSAGRLVGWLLIAQILVGVSAAFMLRPPLAVPASLAAGFLTLAIASALESSQLAALQETFLSARHRAAEAIAGLSLPHLPTRQDILAHSRAPMASSRNACARSAICSACAAH